MSLHKLDQTRRRHFIEGLRAVADFYEQNPDAYYDGMHITLNMYGVARHTLCEMGRVFGPCNRRYDDRNLTVSRQFNEQITVAVLVPRAQVCRRVVTGVRMLPARTVPPAKEVRLPASTVDIVEWKGDPLLPDDARIP